MFIMYNKNAEVRKLAVETSQESERATGRLSVKARVSRRPQPCKEAHSK